MRAVERVLGCRIERTRIPGFTPAQAGAEAQPARDFDRPDRRFSGRPGNRGGNGRSAGGPRDSRGGRDSRDSRGRDSRGRDNRREVRAA